MLHQSRTLAPPRTTREHDEAATTDVGKQSNSLALIAYFQMITGINDRILDFGQNKPCRKENPEPFTLFDGEIIALHFSINVKAELETVLLTGRRSWTGIEPGTVLCGVCRFSLRLRGFSPDSCSFLSQ